MMNGLALKMMKKIPRGKYFTAKEKVTKANVPVMHRTNSVQRCSSLISEKKLTFYCFIIMAEPHMLKNDLKKTNS